MTNMHLAKLTVGLRDDMDTYFQKHETVPSRAWVLSRVLVDDAGDTIYTEEEVRDLPLEDVETFWNEFQEAITPPPLPSAHTGDSCTA